MSDSKRLWQWEEDGMTVTRTNARTGPGCHLNCGVLEYVKDGKLIKVEGDPENPFNQGRLCMRCLSVKDYIYHEDRLQYPMVREGERGENKWRRVTWDEAYDLIEERFNEIKAKYGPSSVLFCQGTGRDIFQSSRLAYAFGSSNWGGPLFAGNSCYLPRMAIMGVTLGGGLILDSSQYTEQRYDHPEFKPAETVFIWGNNPFPSNSDSFYAHWISDLMHMGTKIVVVDPRLTWIAAHADLWLQIRPGTDCALALAMLNVVINEDLYDHEFTEKWCFGFEPLAERVQQYTPAWASEVTWIPEDEIIEAARMYGNSKPAGLQWGVAFDQTTNGAEATQAIIALEAICGNIDVPGGNLFAPPPWGISGPNWTGGWGYDELLSDEEKGKRYGLDKYPLLGVAFLASHPDTTAEAIKNGEIHGIWAQTNNLLGCMSVRPEEWYRYMKDSVDFIVVVDIFPTPTTLGLADVVLPATSFAEKKSFCGLMPYYLGAITNCIEPLGDCRSDQQIILEMGRRFNPEAFPWETVEEMWDYALRPAGVTFAELEERTWLYPDFAYRRYEKGMLRPDGQPGFSTPTGKIELYSVAFEAIGYDPLPYYEEPAESPLKNPEEAKKYPLILTTGARQQAYFHSEGRQIDRWRRMHPDPVVEIHPEDAVTYGVKDGEWVVIENQFGKCRMKAQVTPTIMKGIVNADHGWWFPERDPEDGSLFGAFESNVNSLMDYKCGKTGFGACYKCMICKIYSEKDGE